MSSASVSSEPADADRNANPSSGNNARGEGSSSSARPGPPPRQTTPRRTLDDVMREPSRAVPDVVVLDSLPEPTGRRETLDPKEDLWLTTVDGRYSSLIIPIRVGEHPYAETFYVHKGVLLKSEYFEKALCGKFRESDTQSIDLPEENPAIFHFLVAYLYEGRYEPIKAAASVLVPDQDKGKGNAAADTGADSDSDSATSLESDVSARSRRRRERRRRREDRNWERMRQKHPGMHRPNCNCPQCNAATGPPCWSCRAPRNPPPYHHHAVYMGDRDPLGRPERQPRRPPRRRHPIPPPPPPPLTPPPAAAGTAGAATNPATTSSPTTTTAWPTDPNGGRISGEDLRTWLLAYELNLDVYILANKFLLDGFKKEIARAAIDMLETAGSDAAVVEVLYLCRKLYDGLPESDPLLKMIFARVGFLQPWRRAERETSAFLVGNPEIAPLLLREMAARREDDVNGRALPSMVRPWYAYGGGGGNGGGHGVPGVGGGGQQFDPLGPWRGGGGYHGWPGPVAMGPGPPVGHHGRRLW